MALINTWMFYTWILFLILSIILKYRNNDKWSIFVLFTAAFFLRLFMAHLDPFLNDWDERFHALVARNMIDNPLKPMLRADDILQSNDYRSWCCNYVWLHKQPLFLWQMALSIKIFGVSEYAARYPSVLMGALSVLLLYRITFLLTKDRAIAYGAAFFMSLSHFQLELISGHQGMDHNDVAFGFYILASIWAYAEYITAQKTKWIIWIGIFAGCAILNKWLTGLLVYSAWGINILWTMQKGRRWQQMKPILLSLAVCTIVFLPWQLYILFRFPLEAEYEYAFTRKHIFEVVEDGRGTAWLYWENLHQFFGRHFWWIFIPGIVFYWLDKNAQFRIKFALLTYFLLTFVFFSFIVTTKVIAYFFIVVPIGYIFLSYAVTRPLTRINKHVSMLLMLFLGYHILNYETMKEIHFPRHEDSFRASKIRRTRIYKDMHKTLPSDIKTVVNVGEFSDVELMFYNPGITAYAYWPSEKEFEYFEENKIKVAAFNGKGYYALPDYVRWYTYVTIINK